MLLLAAVLLRVQSSTPAILRFDSFFSPRHTALHLPPSPFMPSLVGVGSCVGCTRTHRIAHAFAADGFPLVGIDVVSSLGERDT